ncbi:hypothetical protein [Actinopolymorpha pittospori]|uniref:Uncharacterized protein n=1 Tax=Actinopolymorpha pittospori TaxID=648752 RepID=A0A927N4Y3_9ACTN|nr:hypothetical protein [Actinopolymorpha pittospori]MBE1608620.1 hypothetical protein [Actinopolymorpha pittospori]
MPWWVSLAMATGQQSEGVARAQEFIAAFTAEHGKAPNRNELRAGIRVSGGRIVEVRRRMRQLDNPGIYLAG